MMSTTKATSAAVNVAWRLTAMAGERPEALAIAAPRRSSLHGLGDYDRLTFREFDERSNRIASGLARYGVRRGMRMAMLVPPGIDFIAITFGLLKLGAVAILIDPGMGRRNLIDCLAQAKPEGFIAIGVAQLVRALCGRFRDARLNVTVGRRLTFGGKTLEQIVEQGDPHFESTITTAGDPAAIIFTTGSTGPPKGVLYTHGNFDAQVELLRDHFQIQPGEIDLPGFPLFGLFNAALGVTTIIPDMNPTRPARVDPRRFLAAMDDLQVTQSFGSPAIWNRVGLYCEANGRRIESLRRVMSAGAPVPAHVLARLKKCLPTDAKIHTPYGATEALPVASITADEVLNETDAQTRHGAGVCVGNRFPSIRWKVIRINDGPIRSLGEMEPLANGEIGELIVRGPVVTREYVTRCEWNSLAKIPDGPDVWHRMGDAGYLDAQDRFWFCGRVAHRLLTADGPMFTIPCEAIFNNHPAVLRSALVGIGKPGSQRPVMIVECWPDKRPRTRAARESLLSELKQLGRTNPLTESISDFLIHPAMPVDIRHNAKIFREKLAIWAAHKLKLSARP
jgi:olefin beta-lactone synthetase